MPPHPDADTSDASDASDAALQPILAVDGEHACYRRLTGELVCWGHRPNGEISADGGGPAITLPEHVTTNGVAIAVAAQISNNDILLADGTVAAWGYDDAFQRLGDGSGQPKAAPGVAIFTGATELLGNPLGEFVCARSKDKSLHCWGYPPLCDPGWPDGGAYSATPVSRPDLAPLETLALGQNFICGTRDGAVECCGQEGYGELGDGVTAPGFRHDLEPVKLPSGLRPSRAYTGLGHACTVTVDATAWCWGWNPDGQLGDGTIASARAIPVPVTNLSNVVQLALGFHHSCARLSDGTVRCWGANTHGQLGDASTVQRLTPAAVVSSGGHGMLSDVVDLHAGWDFSCAMVSSGEVYCWGWNQYGQLGDGTTNDRHVPTKVLGLP